MTMQPGLSDFLKDVGLFTRNFNSHVSQQVFTGEWSMLKVNYLSDSCPNFIYYLFHEGGPYHIETSLLICSGKQWTVSCMTGTSAMKQLNYLNLLNQLTYSLP